MKQVIKKSADKQQEDRTRAQIIALLHDNKITLAAIAKANGLADASGLSVALSRGFPLGEKRIAAALNLHPKTLWPTRYSANGARKKQGYKAFYQPILTPE